MIKYMKALGGLLLASALVACGGGGGSAGTTTGGNTGGNTGGGTGGATVASFIYQLSKNALNNSGSDSSTLTVTALDANNNPVSGAGVTVAVDSGVYTPNSTTTDAKGQVTGAISIGANKANRDITATITVGGQTSQAVISVAGAAISLTPVPATPAPGASVQVSVKVTDANGAGIPSVPVTLSGTLGLAATVTTDSSGNATATLGAAPAAPGTYSVDASALGVQATRSVQVVSGAGGGIPDAVGPISAASLAISPTTIAPNTSGSTAKRAGLKASFLNAANQPIQNVRVRFVVDSPALDANETISTGNATVYSDSTGTAIADYIPGTRSSPTDGVKIKACYGLTDADIANGNCPTSVTKTLTVASQPLSISLGDNNLLERGTNSLTYIKTFDIGVADAAGNAVANAVISASVDITQYGKGPYAAAASTPSGTALYQVTGNTPPTISDTYTTSTTGNRNLSATTTPSAGTGRVWCVNEDSNRNGSVDTGEDINGNGKIDPRKADVILSFVGSNTTGTNGHMQIQVEYPQNVATWLAYTVKVTTNVAGSEGSDSKSYITTFIEGDEKNGSFLTPPYGTQSCVSPN